MNEQIERTNPNHEVSSDTQIISQANNLVKFDPEQDIKQGQKAAKALMKVVEITKPLKLNGKTYLYFEHWQTMAKFFRITVGIESTTKLENGYEAKSIVYQNGTIIGGAEASCLRDEANWKTKPEFQLKSMAQTRAMAKALRSILGYIPVLAGIEATPAEEMSHEEAHQTQENASGEAKPIKADIDTDWECPVHGQTVKFIPAGVTKQGKAYAAFHSCTEKVNGKFCKERVERVIQLTTEQLPNYVPGHEGD